MTTLYDAPDCWKCVEVKAALDAVGLAYEAVTVRGNPGARAALTEAARLDPRWKGMLAKLPPPLPVAPPPREVVR